MAKRMNLHSPKDCIKKVFSKMAHQLLYDLSEKGRVNMESLNVAFLKDVSGFDELNKFIGSAAAYDAKGDNAVLTQQELSSYCKEAHYEYDWIHMGRDYKPKEEFYVVQHYTTALKLAELVKEAREFNDDEKKLVIDFLHNRYREKDVLKMLKHFNLSDKANVFNEKRLNFYFRKMLPAINDPEILVAALNNDSQEVADASRRQIKKLVKDGELDVGEVLKEIVNPDNSQLAKKQLVQLVGELRRSDVFWALYQIQSRYPELSNKTMEIALTRIATEPPESVEMILNKLIYKVRNVAGEESEIKVFIDSNEVGQLINETLEEISTQVDKNVENIFIAVVEENKWEPHNKINDPFKDPDLINKPNQVLKSYDPEKGIIEIEKKLVNEKLVNKIVEDVLKNIRKNTKQLKDDNVNRFEGLILVELAKKDTTGRG